jgi:hypothetical protein
MPQPVSAAFLLKGTVYALEQCGLLLRDASILYRSRSYASAMTLAPTGIWRDGRTSAAKRPYPKPPFPMNQRRAPAMSCFDHS